MRFWSVNSGLGFLITRPRLRIITKEDYLNVSHKSVIRSYRLPTFFTIKVN